MSHTQPHVRLASLTVTLLATACLVGDEPVLEAAPAEARVALRLEARVGDEVLDCTSSYTLADGTPWVLRDLRFYVHDVVLLTAAGERVPLELESDGAWQTSTVALVDLEDGAGNCLNGTSERHDTVAGWAPAGEYVGVAATLGVPETLNHADPTRAEGPLARLSMHWGWQAGYKFLRLDTDRATIHLGSTGCEGTIGHVTSCARPNRAELSFEGVALSLAAGSETALPLVLDVAGLVAGDATCMGGDTESCAAPFTALGLDRATGLPAAQQTTFSLEASP